MHNSNTYIDIKFYKLWKYIPVTRLQKERLKGVLFPLLSVFIRKLATYQNWKNSKVFIDGNISKEKQKINGLNTSGLQSINLAIVIHAFYVDIFEDILNTLQRSENIKYSLYVTCPPDLSHKVRKILSNFDQPAEIMEVKNHGRDILPFLKILPKVLNNDHNLILKLHTKRSNHLNKRELWSSDIFEKLIGEKNFYSIINAFKGNNKLGMLGPEGHILPMSLYYGGNAMRVRDLCASMGLQEEQLRGMKFIAGSMFYARREVLEPILGLGLYEKDFEIENNQLDNTMAHVVERVFAAAVLVRGLKLGDNKSTKERVNLSIVKNHPFTL